MLFSKFTHYFTVISAALCALFVFTGCNNIEKLDSTWCDRKVVIDGFTGEEEWDGARYIYEKHNFILGVMNDETYIYLSLSTSDEALVKKISSYGFTIWFNDNGNKDTTVGFHYPIGKRRREMNMAQQGLSAPQDGEETPNGQDNRESRPPMRSDRMENIMKSIFNQCAIYISDTKDVYTLTLNQAADYDIEAVITVENGLLVYELKFPIVCSKETPFAIGAGTSNSVGVGCISGSMTQSRSSSRRGSRGGMGGMGGMGGSSMGGGMGGSSMGGGMSGGGMGGMGGGMGSGGGIGGMDPSLFEKTKLWFKTELANAPE